MQLEEARMKARLLIAASASAVLAIACAQGDAGITTSTPAGEPGTAPTTGRYGETPAAPETAADPSSPAGNLTLRSAAGESVGDVSVRETATGVLMTIRLRGVAAGVHGLHVHEVGRCEPPSFESAGAHFNPTDAPHGFHQAKGPHLGDLPNVHVEQGGGLEVEVFAKGMTLKPGETSLMDKDGSAIVVHAGADDYTSDPAGESGDRIACGVIAAGDTRTQS
jgi:Cu-Zn family superoxide dismutase